MGVDWRCRAAGSGRQRRAGAPEPSPEDNPGSSRCREWGSGAGCRKEYYEPRKKMHKASSRLGTCVGSSVLGIQRDEIFPDESTLPHSLMPRLCVLGYSDVISSLTGGYLTQARPRCIFSSWPQNCSIKNRYQTQYRSNLGSRRKP